MTESEWLKSTDPATMWVHTVGKGERKHCLFDAACLRRVWHLLRHEASRQAVEVLERYAEGKASFDEIEDANDEADATFLTRGTKADREAAWAVSWGTMIPHENPDAAAIQAANAIGWTSKRSRPARAPLHAHGDVRRGACRGAG
jgi:hypothetical protein